MRTPQYLLRLLLLVLCLSPAAACGDDDDDDTADGDADADVDGDADADVDGDADADVDGDADADVDGDADADSDGDTDADCAAIVPQNGTNVGFTRITGDLDRPVYVTSPPGDPTRLMVVGQRGQIWVVRDGAVSGTFLDIGDQVADNDGADEVGLLGLAFHPDYANNGRFFVYYTNNSGDQVVTEFHAASPDAADAGSEQEILSMSDNASNHNGGCMQFGPDGLLYIGTGDGGGGCNDANPGAPQDTDSMLGKLLRIDVPNAGSYSNPGGNPWGNEVYAIGLRNPWRFSFDRANGDLYIGDVGQDAIEEVDYVSNGDALGKNFGWPNMEGDQCSADTGSSCGWNCEQPGDYVGPVWTYDHGEGLSITGGYVYRGRAMPDVAGTYFFADFGVGSVWSFRIGDVGGSQEFVGSLDAPSSFGEDACGEMYVTTHGGGLYKLTLQ